VQQLRLQLKHRVAQLLDVERVERLGADHAMR
jgi:hypothetical protein